MNNETVEVNCSVCKDDFIYVESIDDVGDIEIGIRTEDGTRTCWIKAGEDLDALIKALKDRRKIYRKGLHKEG